jgi:hypothetical protein
MGLGTTRPFYAQTTFYIGTVSLGCKIQKPQQSFSV